MKKVLKKMAEKPKFDMTVNLGHLIIAGSMISSVAFAWGNLDGRMKTLESTVESNTQIVNKFDVMEMQIEQVNKGVARIEKKLDED